MLDCIKYSRLKFREGNGFFEPKGPKFSNAIQYSFEIIDSTLRFRAPKQLHIFRTGVREFNLHRNQSDLNDLRYDCFHTYKDTWMSQRLFLRQYFFYGPWFSGEKGYTSFSISAIAPDRPLDSINFLHPKAFEAATSGFITALYGQEQWSANIPNYEGPLQWKVKNELPVPAVSFLIRSIKGLQRDQFFMLPVSRDRILVFRFSYEQYAGGNIAEMDAAISPKPAQKLINNIINSVELTPSSELEQELAKIWDICPELSISENVSPLKWPATVDDTGLNIIELNEERRKALAR